MALRRVMSLFAERYAPQPQVPKPVVSYLSMFLSLSDEDMEKRLQQDYKQEQQAKKAAAFQQKQADLRYRCFVMRAFKC